MTHKLVLLLYLVELFPFVTKYSENDQGALGTLLIMNVVNAP